MGIYVRRFVLFVGVVMILKYQKDCNFILRITLHDSYETISPLFSDAASAEVTFHGCCSSLEKIPHHLKEDEMEDWSSPQTGPRQLVSESDFKVEIMTPTTRENNVRTRSVSKNQNLWPIKKLAVTQF